jgi:hypothetical protein
MARSSITLFYLRGAATAVIVICFFLPWVRLSSLPADILQNTLSTIFTGSSEKGLVNISGADMPRLANHGTSGISLKILQIFFPGMRELDNRIWYIWAVPGASIALLYLGHWFGKAKHIHLVLMMAYGLAGGWAYMRLNPTLFHAVLFKIELCTPFLIIMWTWLGLAAVHLLLHFSSK